MSGGTILRIVAAWLFLLVLSPAASQTGNIDELVKSLGRKTSKLEDIFALSKTPKTSVARLIEQLRVVPERRLLASEHPFAVEHVVSCITALRFLTGGQDFCAPTAHVFAKTDIEQRRKVLLEIRHGSCLAFFAVWPSRMSTYIAPSDAQQKIIAQWKSWFRKEGWQSNYTPLVDPKPEEWLW